MLTESGGAESQLIAEEYMRTASNMQLLNKDSKLMPNHSTKVFNYGMAPYESLRTDGYSTPYELSIDPKYYDIDQSCHGLA